MLEYSVPNIQHYAPSLRVSTRFLSEHVDNKIASNMLEEGGTMYNMRHHLTYPLTLFWSAIVLAICQ
jgi:hypothetical protein